MTFFIPEDTKYPAERVRFISGLNASASDKSVDVKWAEFYRRFAAAISDGDLMTAQEYQDKYGEAIKRNLLLT